MEAMHGGVWEKYRITALFLRAGQAVPLPALDVATHPPGSSPHFSSGSQHAIGTWLSHLTLCPPQAGGEEFQSVTHVWSAPPLKLSKDLPESTKEVWSKGFIMNDKGHSHRTGNS